MKKIIIALGLALITSSAFASHTSGLAAHQARQAVAQSHSHSSVGVNVPHGVGVYIATEGARTNIVTDPESCLKKWGEHCVQSDREDVSLDLGDTDIQAQDTRVNPAK